MTTLKAQCRTKDLKVGHFIVEFLTPGIGHICKNAGCDFVFLDMEHSAFGFDIAKAGIRFFEAANVPVMVRAPSKEPHHIARTLDIGAEGIILPMVNDAEEARHLLDCIRYAPAGMRGVALGIAHDSYRAPVDVMGTLREANDRVAFVALIETEAGVENAEAIAALDGVDCLWIGHFDLSCSLGIPGEFGHEKFLDAVEKVKAAANSTGKALGRLVPTVESGIALHGEGFDFICYSGDVWVLGAGIRAGVDAIREGAATAPAPAVKGKSPARSRARKPAAAKPRTTRRRAGA
jgi:2-keto-3-deoxy-L-rhamnonate aldolase RhmA